MASILPPSAQLLAFKTVVEEGSFTGAADRLNLSQSAISHQISKLERSWGLRLLERSARGMTLTNEGDSLYAAIAGPLNELLAAFERPQCRSGQVRILRIQVETVFASAWLASRLADFLASHPNLQLEQYRPSDRQLPEKVDLMIKWGNGTWTNMVSEPLLALHYTPVCAPAMVEKGIISRPEDLCTQVLLHDRRTREWERWFKTFNLTHPHPRRGHFVDDSHLLLKMAAEARGIAIMSPLLIQRELASGLLVCPFPEMRLDLKERYHIVTRTGQNLSHDAQTFIMWLRKQAKE